MARSCGFWGAVLLGGILVSLVAVAVAPRLVNRARAQAPVTAEAAERAAQELFARTFGCGSLDGAARDEGGHWAFSARVGYAAELDPEPIMVNKRTGIATWATHDRVQRGEWPPIPPAEF